jgi:hypothetical protein
MADVPKQLADNGDNWRVNDTELLSRAGVKGGIISNAIASREVPGNNR